MRTDIEKRTSQDEVKKFAKRALAVALLVILTEVLFESFIVGIFKDQTPLLAFGFLFSYMFLQICFFLHSIGNALLSPTCMAILVKEKPPHQQGKRYGLVESTDTLAFLIATSTVMLFKYLKVLFSGLISFACFSCIFSWRFYGRFKNLS